MANGTRKNNVKRGSVTKSFQQINVLAGFMDEQHYLLFTQEHYSTLNKREQKAHLKKAEQARQFASSLPSIDLSDAENRPLEPKYYEKLAKDKMFSSTFGTTQHRFGWVKPEKLVALQVCVNAQKESVPKSKKGLVGFALPKEWSIPAEITFTPPFGPIYIVSSSPQLSAVEVGLDGTKGHVIIKPPNHINLIQVMHFQGRYYLRNGYHRVVGAIEAGLTEIPALIVEATQPADVELPSLGIAGLNAGFSMTLPRPALVSDFKGNATVAMPMREKRYGASVSLQISPISIGV